MKKIAIKFTVAKGIPSFALVWFFKHKYTHAAIGLENGSNEFYSFAYKGFSTEGKRSYIPKTWRENYAYYYIDVEDTHYLNLMERIEHFKLEKTKYKYSNLEVICAFFRIPYKHKDHYFCSYFVAELLSSTGIFALKKAPNLYLPYDLAKAIGRFHHVEYSC